MIWNDKIRIKKKTKKLIQIDMDQRIFFVFVSLVFSTRKICQELLSSQILFLVLFSTQYFCYSNILWIPNLFSELIEWWNVMETKILSKEISQLGLILTETTIKKNFVIFPVLHAHAHTPKFIRIYSTWNFHSVDSLKSKSESQNIQMVIAVLGKVHRSCSGDSFI